MIDIRQFKGIFEKKIWAIVSIATFVAKGKRAKDWSLIEGVEKESKGNGDLLAFIEKKVLQLHFLQQAVATAQITHQLH